VTRGRLALRADRLRAPHAIGLLFVANGLVPALWPRFPEVKDAVGADDALFGLALLGTGLGGVVGSALAPWVVRRLGARRAAADGALVLAVLPVLVGLAGSVPALFAAFALLGLGDGVADMAQNHLMFEVQRTTPRSLTSRMHALWSSGALAATAIGTLAAFVGVSVAAQSGVLAVVAWGLVGTGAWLLRRQHFGDRGATTAATTPVTAGPDATSGRRRTRWVGAVVAAVAVAAVEGVGNEWSALTLRDGFGAGALVAGAGPTAFAGAMLVGRLVGDRVIDRIGIEAASRVSGALVAVGAGAGLVGAAALDLPVLLVAGLVAAGIGAAVLFPSMLAVGDRLDASGTGVAVAASASRVGFLAVPVVVGTIADAVGLPVAFGLMPLAGVAVALVLPRALAGSAAAGAGRG
jgi:fucose permease